MLHRCRWLSLTGFVLHQVVEGGSALIGDARERRDTMHADHVNMVKFLDHTDDRYVKILNSIKVLLKEKLRSTGESKLMHSIYLMTAYGE